MSDDQTTGLYLMVSVTRLRSFVFRYSTPGGRRCKYHIGRWPEWSATMARDEVAVLRRKLAQGIDPQRQRREARSARPETTVAALAEEYLSRYAAKKKSGARDREIVDRDVLPELGDVCATQVARSDVRRLFEAKSAATPVAANRLLACLSKVFSWAVEQEVVTANPCAGIRKNPEKARNRVLTEGEIRTLWRGLDAVSGVTWRVKTVIKLILVTAQRPGEVAGMRRSEFDGEWWMLPGERTKNGKRHRVPLTSLARELLETVPGTGDALFPAARGAKDTLLVSSLAHAVRKARFVDLRPWVPHDLRRTSATSMASAGVQPHIIDRLLNHTDPSTRAKHYDLYLYDSEKRDALERWEKILRRVAEIDYRRI